MVFVSGIVLSVGKEKAQGKGEGRGAYSAVWVVSVLRVFCRPARSPTMLRRSMLHWMSPIWRAAISATGAERWQGWGRRGQLRRWCAMLRGRDSPAKTRELAKARTAKRKTTARDIMFAKR